MKNIAIIPARSGSKGLKDKNIKLLNGKPLMAYSIESAMETGIFDEIFVSTDSKEYAKIAIEYGAQVPFMRCDELSTDEASSWDVIKDALKNYKTLGREFDSVCILQPTSPLRKSTDIIAGYELLKAKNANAIVGVCEVDHSPLWCNTLPEDSSLDNFINKELVNLSRQSLPTYYRINGALYITKGDYLMRTMDIYSEKCYAYVMRKENSIDIDDSFDFMVAEAIIK